MPKRRLCLPLLLLAALAHPGQGNDTLAALKGKPILIAPAARLTFWNF